uniref:ATP synthase complex subunit 8 n=1 Tax=Metapenaeopsis dalei TaxID=467289 RepID=A0A125R7H4_9EUCA|nr:ATP synthase F0 subunit 8 [Metapenaeopsis dalei]AMD15641.1 ATP synthase F0 subunit 8 [Metapenaeopsis dalei]
MPQMAPLLWLNLFVMFSFTFILFLVLNYFIKVPSKIEKPSLFMKKSEMNWKW